MKILQLGKFYPPDMGGIQMVMYNLTEVLNKVENVESDVLCSNTSYNYTEERKNTYKIYRTKSLGIYFSTSISPQMIFKLREIIHDYDIIHIHLPDPMANLALFLTPIKNKKIIVHWHSDILKQKYILKLYQPLQSWLLRRADKIIVTSPKYAEGSISLQAFREKCIVVPIGIDQKRLKATASKVKYIRDTYKNKKIIFSLGRLVYYKGFQYLIESAKYMSDNFIVLIAGSGPLESELQQSIEKHKLNTHVFLLGSVKDEDLGNYYAACDLFVLPSIEKSEAFGIVQIEAMSYAKPVVATNIPGSGVAWVNQDKYSGLNVSCKNPKALAEACHTILDDIKIYDDYGKKAHVRFLSLFQDTKMGESMIDIYKKI